MTQQTSESRRIEAGTRTPITVTVNGNSRTAETESRRTLSDYLRHDLGLTGTHVGCEHGVCGACTVLMDGEPVRSCLTLAVTAQGHEITTVEGLSPQATGADPATIDPDSLSPVQRAFRDCHALQCGFCTPGFLTTITAGLEQNPTPTRDEAVEMIAGNLCRCTGYQNIVDAVLRAAELTADPEAVMSDRFAPHDEGRTTVEPPEGRDESLPGEATASSAPTGRDEGPNRGEETSGVATKGRSREARSERGDEQSDTESELAPPRDADEGTGV